MSGVWDLDKQFADQVRALITGSKMAVRGIHGYRSPEEAQKLWAEAERVYGSAADQYIARPGQSNHERRVAMDVVFADDAAHNWVKQNAHRYGIEQPMPWEPWHLEPMGLRLGTYRPGEFKQNRAAYTWQRGQVHPADRNTGASSHAAALRGILRQPIPDQSPLTDDDPEALPSTLTAEESIDGIQQDPEEPVEEEEEIDG
jgi:hypothetical protein